MRKLVFLLAIVAVAAAPSLASAKTKHHARAHSAKMAKPYSGPNADAKNLFHDMIRGK